MAGRVLIVDDDSNMCDVLAAGLPQRGYAAVACTKPEDALALLDVEDFDVLVTDLNMRGMRGSELCARVVQSRPDVPVIVITAFGSLDAAVESIRAGAYDFVTKPFELKTLTLAIDRAAQHRRLRQEVRRLRQEVANARPVSELVGESAPLQKVRDLVERLADTDASVLITGESGTGKEVAARILHAAGRRSGSPFVAINCAALPESLLEAELFGWVKGAFTDARAPHAGLFVQAHGGTLFLDEIGEMPLPLQVKLLRALQERRVRPIGGSGETPIDVRIVSATNTDLEQAIEDKRFREDLYFRVNVVQVELPPLRARGNDILLLAQHFLARFATRAGRPIRGFSATAAERLLAYPWPGNVRELQNAVERAVALTRFEEISLDDLPDKIRDFHRAQRLPPETNDPVSLLPLEEVERRYILQVLDAVGGSRSEAVKILGMDRKTLYRKLEKWGRPNDG